MIEVHDLRKSFGATSAVAGVSFDVRAGETFGLLGPNGAGKSTTIAMLTGAIAPDSGSIRLADRGAPSEPATRRRIGVAPQTLSLYEELTAAENLKFFGRMYGLTGAKLAERVEWALAVCRSDGSPRLASENVLGRHEAAAEFGGGARA